MNEIKFRVWEMSEYGNAMREVDLYFFEEEGIREIPKDSQGYYEVMQYTGLKDANGVEIYEGDIVKVSKAYDKDIFNSDREDHIATVWKDDEVSCINIGDVREGIIPRKDLAQKYYEVIGNIYENPELLK